VSNDVVDPDSSAAAPFRAVAAGDRLGRYDLLAPQLAITSAKHRGHPAFPDRREVAIKVLFPHLNRRRDAVQRFHREARAAARLRHPGILQTYDVGGGEHGEPPYIVMELVRGPALHDHLAINGAILSELVACIGVLIAEALIAAHGAGVIHRDLKPANLLVADDGRLLLADFGVARVDRDESLATRTGAVLGTVAYMSPEQASGDAIDARSDLYSLGATLYHLATGAVPYGGSAMKVMSQLATPGALISPMQRRPAVGRPLSSVIVQLMATDPQQRPASAAAAAALLRPLTLPLGDPATALAAYWRDPVDYVDRQTPVVVAALVDTARRLHADGRLAAAISLADRALALAPGDPRVTALARAVTSPLATNRRFARRGAVVAALCGLTVLAWLQREPSVPATSPDVAAAADAVAIVNPTPPIVPALGVPTPVTSVAAPIVATPPDIVPTVPIVPIKPRQRAAPVAADPGTMGTSAVAPSGPSAAPAGGESVVEVAAVTEAPEAPIDSPRSDPDSGAATGAAIFEMDAWCELMIDGIAHGRADRTRALTLPVGRHVAQCSQGPGLGQWRGEFEISSGAPQRIRGELRSGVQVTADVAGRSIAIDGKTISHRRHAMVRNGRHRVVIFEGTRELRSGWVSVPRVARCTLRDLPVLDCYP
jgi:Protein kinase domain